jgi:hypothetical protein
MECDCSALFVNIFTRTIDCVKCGEWKVLAWFFLDVHVERLVDRAVPTEYVVVYEFLDEKYPTLPISASIIIFGIELGRRGSEAATTRASAGIKPIDALSATV